MSRWKAAGIHFLLSAFVAVAAIAVVVFVMFPPPYTGSAGAGKLLIILIGVDVTLGPLITLIIYRHGKPGLKFDLFVIAALQLSALIYGLTMIAGSRPVYLVHLPDRFALVSANSLSQEALAAAPPVYRELPWTGPRLVSTELSPEAKLEVMMVALEGGPDADGFPKYYVDYEKKLTVVLENAKPLAGLRSWSEQADMIVSQWLADGAREAAEYVYYPMRDRRGYSTLVLNARTAQPVDVLPIDPW